MATGRLGRRSPTYRRNPLRWGQSPDPRPHRHYSLKTQAQTRQNGNTSPHEPGILRESFDTPADALRSVVTGNELRISSVMRGPFRAQTENNKPSHAFGKPNANR